MTTLSLIIVAFSLSQTKAAPDLLQPALEATKLTYSASSSGLSYVLDFTHEDKKLQRIFIAKKAESVGDSKMVTIYSNVWIGKKEPPPEAILLKTINRAKKFGQFYIYKDSNGVYAMRFGAQFDLSTIPANPKEADKAVTQLKDMIYFVDQVGYESTIELAKLGG